MKLFRRIAGKVVMKLFRRIAGKVVMKLLRRIAGKVVGYETVVKDLLERWL